MLEKIKNAQSDVDFDVYGHLDYVVRYGPNKNQFYSYQKYAEVIDEILRTLIQKGKGIELNTAGFKYGLGHAHPTLDILKRYKELGGEILTIGSDGHTPEQIAWEFDIVPSLLKEAGFDVISIGKINDIFNTCGITEAHKTVSNHHGMEILNKMADNEFRGLCFLNLVDFDATYGHRRNPEGYKECLLSKKEKADVL